MAEAWDSNLGGSVEIDAGDVWVILVGEIDAGSATTLQRRLDEAGELTTGAVVLDMSGVTFIDSTGLSVVIRAHQGMGEDGRSLLLRHISAPVRRLLEITGVGPALGLDGPALGLDGPALGLECPATGGSHGIQH
jgi:anti-anti-sigma factor